jgi:HEAT repeat protein
MDGRTIHQAETVEELIAHLRGQPYGRVWWHAIEQLAWFGPPAVPALIEVLDANAEPLRRAAAQSLGRIGPPARRATRSLLDRLFDPAADVRSDAAWALAQIAPPLKGALPLLLGRLAAEENRAVQRRLLCLLGGVGPTARAALPLLYPLLDNPFLFPDALSALRAIAPDDPHLLQVLREQLGTTDAPFRALAAETVGKLRLATPEWIAELTRAARCRDAQTRHAARTALEKIQAAERRQAEAGPG